jgi:hypothetical protein
MSADQGRVWPPLVSGLGLALAAWFGMLLAVATLAAPALFFTLERQQAAEVASRLFTLESRLSLGLAALLFLGARAWSTRLRSDVAMGPDAPLPALLAGLSWGSLLVMFTTLLSEEVLRPWMAQAKSGGDTLLGFAALHTLAGVLFGGKALTLAWMAWQTSRVRQAPSLESPDLGGREAS